MAPVLVIFSNNHCKRFAQSAGPLVSFSRILQYLGLTFTISGALLEAFLQSWDHFWSTLATFFEQKTDLRRQRCHQRCQREIFPVNTHLLGPHLGVFFADLLLFRMKSSCFFQSVFKALFLWCFLCVFEQVESVKTIKNTARFNAGGSRSFNALRVLMKATRACLTRCAFCAF